MNEKFNALWNAVLERGRELWRIDSTPKIKKLRGEEAILVHNPPERSRIVFLVMFVGFVLVIGRSAYLQCGFETRFLQKKGDEHSVRILSVASSRGKIQDRNGVTLASSVPAKSIWANPTEFSAASKSQLRKLAKKLDLPVETIEKRLQQNGSKSFMYLARQIEPEDAKGILDMGVPGLFAEDEVKRKYPDGEIAAHVVGFTDSDNRGREGVELARNSVLSGEKGMRYIVRDRLGRVVDILALKETVRGEDVMLSIDSRLQYTAFNALKKAVVEAGAKAGAVVVADVHTGEVLAMSNWPTYDPNERKYLRIENVRNRVITDTFEPGSTMKPFAIAKALDCGIVRSDTLIDTAPGVLTIGDRVITDTHNYGTLSVSQIVSKSSNIGTCKIAFEVDSEELWKTYDALGFGHSPNIGFPGVAPGRLRNGKQWRPIEKATISYGYGISVSLMQLVRAYTALARNGDVIDLTFNKTTREAQGQQIFRPEVARQMRTMMAETVSENGTARRVSVQGYTVAGKTGTANKIRDGKYVDKLAVASFIGMAPASQPRLIVAVMIDEPTKGSYFGGTVTAPVFNEVTASALRYLGVHPDEPGFAAGSGLMVRGGFR